MVLDLLEKYRSFPAAPGLPDLLKARQRFFDGAFQLRRNSEWPRVDDVSNKHFGVLAASSRWEEIEKPLRK